jgi:hypothetical protein
MMTMASSTTGIENIASRHDQSASREVGSSDKLLRIMARPYVAEQICRIAAHVTGDGNAESECRGVAAVALRRAAVAV